MLSYLSIIINAVIGLATSSFLIRSLGEIEYGLYQSMTAFVNYLVMFEFGTGSVMTRNILSARNSNNKDEIKKAISTVWYASLFLSLLIVILGGVFYNNIERIYAKTISPLQMMECKKMFLIMLIYLVFNYLSQTMTGIHLGFENYTIKQKIELIKIIIRTVFLILVISFVKKAIVITTIDVVLSFLVAAFYFIYCKIRYKINFAITNFDFRILKFSLPLCFALLIQTVVNQANGNVDKFIISISLNMQSVAVYSVAMYIYSMFSSISTTPITMYMPQISKDLHSGLEGRALTKTFIPAGRLVSIVCGIAMFGFIAVGKNFINIVYGEKYLEAYYISIILLIPTFFNMTVGMLVNVLDVLNKRQIRSYFLIFTTIINIVLTIIFIKYFGMIGAAIATAISTMLGQVFCMNIYYYKVLNIDIPYLYKQAYSGIIISEGFACVLTLFITYFISNFIISFFAGAIIFLITTFVMFMIYGFNGNEKKAFINLINKIKVLKK